MEDKKVNIKFKDENGNIHRMRECEDKEPVHVVNDVTMAALIILAAIWALKYFHFFFW